MGTMKNVKFQKFTVQYTNTNCQLLQISVAKEFNKFKGVPTPSGSNRDSLKI